MSNRLVVLANFDTIIKMMKIIQEQEKCIGCGSCEAVCPKFWKLDYDMGKAVLKGARKNDEGKYELEVRDVGCNQEAVDVCPVDIIKITK